MDIIIVLNKLLNNFLIILSINIIAFLLIIKLIIKFWFIFKNIKNIKIIVILIKSYINNNY